MKKKLYLLVFNSGKRLGVKSLPLSWNPPKATKKYPSAQNVAMVWELFLYFGEMNLSYPDG
jgi:hypothetical protein